MAAGATTHPRPHSRLRAWLRSDMPIARWILLLMHLTILITAALALDESPPKLVFILPISLFFAIIGYFFGFDLHRPAAPISRARLLIPVSICAFFLTVLAAGIFYSISEATNTDPLHIPEFAVQWVLLYAAWLYGDFSIIRHGFRGTFTNILFGSAETIVLVLFISWLLIAFTTRHNASRFDLATQLSFKMLFASLLALAIILPCHIFVMHRGGFFTAIATNPSLRGASLSLLFALGSLVILIFLRPFYREHASTENPTCRHCGYDLRASPDRCPECGEPVAPAN